jgi:L-2-hydroxyglutarate oxidase LhgO
LTDRVDCAVIGAGVVGLAIGRALAHTGREVVILERNAGIGEETSSRNSEVIHAGLYYPTGSLKAGLCVRGKVSLYAYCRDKQIPFQRCGKLIVASASDQLPRLTAIAGQAERNGVTDLLMLDADEVAQREPAIRAAGGLWSPSTGIVDSHALMLALRGDFEAANGLVATQSTVSALDVRDAGIGLQIESGDQSSELVASTVVNAAGLGAHALATNTSGAGDYDVPAMQLAKGNYFAYSAAHPFRNLIYPLPMTGGLGIHATIDLAGQLRFGPDVEWVDTIDYSVDPARRDSFVESIRQFWPAVDADALTPAYAGIRPKLKPARGEVPDFRLDVVAGGAARQLVHLLGIESPGLTSALALAAATCARLELTTAGAVS